MSDPAPVPRGNGVMSAAGDTANRIVAGLTGTPTLLVMVVLNVALIGVAGWYLSALEGYRHIERLETIKFFAACMKGANP
jgi:hypothetical protein